METPGRFQRPSQGTKAAAFDSRVRSFIHGDAAKKMTQLLKEGGANIEEPGFGVGAQRSTMKTAIVDESLYGHTHTIAVEIGQGPERLAEPA